MKWKSLIIQILIIGSFPRTAISQQPSVRNFSTSDYNGGTQNWCINQAGDQRMLFANNNGLLSYDSDKWILFPISNNTNIRSVFYDKNTTRIYAGASNEFGYYQIDSISNQINYHSLSRQLPLQYRYFDEIWNIFKYNNQLAFQAKKFIFLQKEDGGFMIFPINYRIECSAVIDNKIIIACKEAIYYIFNNQIHRISNSGLLHQKTIRAIIPYKNGTILFATASSGLFIFDGFSLKPLRLDISNYLTNNQIFCGTIHDNYLAFGTVRGGLVIKNLKTHQNAFVNVHTGLQNNTILSLYFDKQDNIWLGLDRGISYVLLNAPFQELFGGNNEIGTGYSSLIFKHFFYAGTNQGLFYASYPLSNTPVPEQTHLVPNMTGQVWSLRNIHKSVLCGNNDGAFFISDTIANRIKGTQGTWDFKTIKNHPNLVLACDYQSLYILQKNQSTWSVRNRISGFSETSAAFEEDSDGTIWLAHWQKGIYHIRLSDNLQKATVLELFNAKNGLPTDDNNLLSKINGQIYISAADGFYSYNKLQKKLQKESKLDSLYAGLSDPVRLIETPNHAIWAITEHCLAIARPDNKKDYHTDLFSFRLMAKQLQTKLGNINFIENDQTIFNHENGFIVVNNNYKSKDSHAPVIIKQILGTNSNDTILYSGTTHNYTDILKIPHQQNSIKIDYVWPEYSAPKAISYSCYLENYENKWANQQTNGSKEYTKLPQGTYLFHVRGSNEFNGLVREQSIEFTILPAWYETIMAISIYFILIIVCLFYLSKYIKHRYNKKIHLIELTRERQLHEREIQLEIEQQRKEKELIQSKNRELQIELKHKSSLLADSTMNLIRKNDILQSLDNEIAGISQSIYSNEAKQLINRKFKTIHKNIQLNITDDANWEKFEENFNLVYTDYMQKLTERFPDLKINDRKLCAYLRMRLSSKEIASLFNSSVRSIETARYRLRKKLNLKHDDNLTDFIQSL